MEDPLRTSRRQTLRLINKNRITRELRSTKETDHPWLTINTPLSDSPTEKTTQYMNTNTPLAASSTSKYDWKLHSLNLCRHILSRGLTGGIGSDLQVYVPTWNKSYNLHRLILDQNPYFKLLLQGAFKEAETNTITLHFDDEPFITMDSFQFVLEYLYGKIDEPLITQANVREILATSSYFQLDVCGMCVDFILRNLSFTNVVDYLLFADSMMVQGSDRIYDAVFTFLCREAYYMDRNIVARLSVDWLQKVIESDAFWVPSEFERYQFIRQIIFTRYDQYKNSSDTFELRELDTNPHCTLVSESVYYMHMTFEQLESIQNDKNPFTNQPLVPEKVLRDALWKQVQFRSKIVFSCQTDTTLNTTLSSKSRQEDEKYYLVPTDDTTTFTGESSTTLASSNHSKKTPEPIATVEQYSVYPPFRFSVEFTDVASLKYDVQVYSETVFYAGSNWNVYIQKTKSLRKGVLQLGVYLHRQSIPSENHRSSSKSSNKETWSFSRYSDKRETIKTWFRIYCPSRGPKHALTLFQSSPDNFELLQSWGWRSSTLCADEELNNINTIDTATSSETPPPVLHTPQTSNQLHYLQSTYDLRTLKFALNNITINNSSHSSSNSSSSSKDGTRQQTGPTVRFTVVMGHV